MIPVYIDCKDSHTVKVVPLRIRNGIPEILLLEHKIRPGTPPQKSGRKFTERKRWGLPGGKVEEGESFIATLIREGFEEAKLDLKNLLNEKYVFHSTKKISKRVGYATHQDHYFFVLLPPDTEIGEIEEDNDEIVRGQFFQLDKMPTPDEDLPFTKNQLYGLIGLLRSLIGKIENADKWLASVEKWAYPYLP